MLVADLLKQEWKKTYRAKGFYKNLAVSIMLGFFGIYVAVILLILGFALSSILDKANGTLNPLELFNGSMLYLMLIGLSIRFFMQQLNTLNLPPYQVLPIKRSSLINFLLLKPLASPVNYFLLLVVVPFAIKSVIGYYSVVVAIRFVLSFIFLVWFNSLLAAFLKRKFGTSLLSFLFVIVIMSGIGGLEYLKVFSLFNISKSLYGFIILNPVGLILPILLAVAAFLLNKWFFFRNYYPEKFNSKIRGDKTIAADLSFLNRFGITGDLLSLEIKLILRHKRTKSILYLSAFFLFYGLLFYTNKPLANNYGMLFFAAMFVTGFLMLILGQWVISWDGSHFDSLMTKNIPVRSYMNANYYLLVGFNVISFVLTTPYFFFGSKVVYFHLAAFLFNVGVNVYLLLYLATYKSTRIDLTKSSAMNYQGTSYKSMLIILPIMFTPILIVYVLSTFISLSVALWTLSLLGIAGILFRSQIITLCVNQFNSRKYKMAEGFREGE
jgi:hypothetical protein